MWQGVIDSSASAAVALIRLMVGAVFLSEGIQKFLFPDQLGAGRFLKIGLQAELLQHAQRLRNDLSPDAVTGQNGDVHVRSTRGTAFFAAPRTH